MEKRGLKNCQIFSISSNSNNQKFSLINSNKNEKKKFDFIDLFQPGNQKIDMKKFGR